MHNSRLPISGHFIPSKTLAAPSMGRFIYNRITLIDQEQGLALLDLRAFLVDALEQHARHARAYVGAAERRQAADQLTLQRQGLRLGVDRSPSRHRSCLSRLKPMSHERFFSGFRSATGAEVLLPRVDSNRLGIFQPCAYFT